MNLVAYSMKTKGGAAFGRRLWTVFTRFGLTEGPTRRSFQAMIEALRPYDAAPTFFVPAAVLGRSPSLIRRVQRTGAELGIHGYVHNDYRALTKDEQVAQISQAMDLFRQQGVRFEGFRNPYLGWNEDSLAVFRELGFVYDSNEAVIHDVLDPSDLPPALADSFHARWSCFRRFLIVCTICARTRKMGCSAFPPVSLTTRCCSIGCGCPLTNWVSCGARSCCGSMRLVGCMS